MGVRPATRLGLGKKVVFSLVPAIVLLGLAEIAARVFYTRPPAVLVQAPLDGVVNLTVPDFFEYHPRLFWVLRPGIRRPPSFWGDITNSRGFRMKSEPGDRREKVRILCLGDSCTYGLRLPLDHAWPAALDRLLESAEVVNAGVPGYSSYQGRVLFEDRCEDLEPDVLVVAFGQNDVMAWPSRQDGQIVQLHDRDRAEHIGYARTSSRLLQWLLSRRLRRPEVLRAGTSPEYWLPRVSITDFRANLEHFAGLAPIVVFVAWVRRKELDPRFEEVYPLERLRRYDQVILSMRAAGHSVLSVEALFRKSGLPPDRLFVDSVHATKEGAQLVAQELARHLR